MTTIVTVSTRSHTHKSRVAQDAQDAHVAPVKVIHISTSRRSALAAWLRTIGSERLDVVLTARPDAVRPPEPRTLGELADRLQRPASVALALPRLPLPCLQVAEAMAALGTPVPRKALTALLEAPPVDSPGKLKTALQILADHALVWPDGTDQLCMSAPLRRAWQTPLGLGPRLAELLADTSSDELRKALTKLGLQPPPRTKSQRLEALLQHHSDPDRIRALVATAPEPTRRLLAQHTADAPDPHANPHPHLPPSDVPASGAAKQWALERLLLVKPLYAFQQARMPAEVALALRGPAWRAPFDPAPPEPALVPITAAEVDREAAATATAFAAQAAALLAECAVRPPATLKPGGVGARELARLGKAAQCAEPVVRTVLECAYAAGLLARDGVAQVAVTEAYDAWSEQDPAGQLTNLLRAWWLLGLTPSQSRDENNKAMPSLTREPAPGNSCRDARDARHALLTAAAGLPASHGVRNPADLGLLVIWHRPLTHHLPQDANTPFATLVREAELLGVLARGALSPLGKALLSGDASALTAAAERLLPAAADRARIGADLTAVVTGTPSARLAAFLDSLADREARGTASVWRFGPSSVRRALDAGRTAEAIATGLTAISDGPLPQPLAYLITDTARRHGRIRLTSAPCVIHGAEPALLSELAVHRRLAGLGLRQLAPTVLVSRTPLAETLEALRAEGYAPVAETADGTVRIEKPAHHRAPAQIPHPRRAPTLQPAMPAPSDLASRLLAAPDREPHPDPYNGVPFRTDTEEILAHYAEQLTLTDMRQLAHAIHENEPITIEYVAASGNRTVRTLSALEFDPPYLAAFCHLRDAERVFTLSRIQAVMPVMEE